MAKESCGTCNIRVDRGPGIHPLLNVTAGFPPLDFYVNRPHGFHVIKHFVVQGHSSACCKVRKPTSNRRKGFTVCICFPAGMVIAELPCTDTDYVHHASCNAVDQTWW